MPEGGGGDGSDQVGVHRHHHIRCTLTPPHQVYTDTTTSGVHRHHHIRCTQTPPLTATSVTSNTGTFLLINLAMLILRAGERREREKYPLTLTTIIPHFIWYVTRLWIYTQHPNQIAISSEMLKLSVPYFQPFMLHHFYMHTRQ